MKRSRATTDPVYQNGTATLIGRSNGPLPEAVPNIPVGNKKRKCLCRTMYGYVGLSKAMYGYVCLCVAMYGHVWLCRAMYMVMFGYYCLCMAMYGYAWLCMAMYGYVCL